MKATRRSLIFTSFLLPFALAGCESRPKPVFEALSFDYLTKIKVDVGTIDINDSWAPRGSARQVGFLAPTRPVVALRTMASDRIVPGGTSGRATFVIDNASIIQDRSNYIGDFAVHLDIFDAQDEQVGTVSAKVHGNQKVTDDEDEDAVRTDLDTLVRRMMGQMNVEFEFQLRKALRDKMQVTSPAAPAPDAVDAEDLQAPTKKPKP